MSWSRFISIGVSCFFIFLLWDGQAIYFWGGGGGLSKEKQSHAQEKEKKLVHKEAWENVYASLTYFWDLYNGNVTKEILIFLIVFEWKVLNTPNFDLPDIIKQPVAKMLRHALARKTDLSCFKSLLVTGLWKIILTSQSCSSKVWAWSCIASNFDKPVEEGSQAQDHGQAIY